MRARSLFDKGADFILPRASLQRPGEAVQAARIRLPVQRPHVKALDKILLALEAGEHKQVAVKVIDDRGIESLKIVEVK